jgi:hypothetical protein
MTPFDVVGASCAGIVSGGVVAIVLALGRTRGLLANSEMMMGTAVVSRSATLAWLAGAAMSVAVSGLSGVCYAVGFEYVTYRTGIGAGILLAVVHTVISGLALAVLPAMHPGMRSLQSPAPGVFKSNLGARDVSAFVLLHLLFGAIVGVLYHPSTASLALGAGP